MVNRNFTLQFKGYWRDSEVHLVPSESGIYCVYACNFFKDRNTLGINDILYVGESDNVGEVLTNHKDKKSWLDYTAQNYSGEILCYSFAPMDKEERGFSRQRIVEIIVHEHKPLLMEKVDEFSPAYAPFNTRGRNAQLHPYYDPLM